MGTIKKMRSQIGILEGYNDKELLEIPKGIIAVFRGIFLEKLSGKNPKEIKNT